MTLTCHIGACAQYCPSPDTKCCPFLEHSCAFQNTVPTVIPSTRRLAPYPPPRVPVCVPLATPTPAVSPVWGVLAALGADDLTHPPPLACARPPQHPLTPSSCITEGPRGLGALGRGGCLSSDSGCDGDSSWSRVWALWRLRPALPVTAALTRHTAGRPPQAHSTAPPVLCGETFFPGGGISWLQLWQGLSLLLPC